VLVHNFQGIWSVFGFAHDITVDFIQGRFNDAPHQRFIVSNDNAYQWVTHGLS